MGHKFQTQKDFNNTHLSLSFPFKTMKLFLATLFLNAIVSCESSMLRLNKQVIANNNIDGKTILDAEVILKGTTGEPTVEDMNFIGKALVASYNNVHWEVGHYMTGDHVVEPVGILCKYCPDDDTMGDVKTNVFSVKTSVGILCKYCPDDDAMGSVESLLMTALTNDCAGLCKKDAAAELEVNFCNKIRSAEGSKYLNSAKSCSIKFDTENKNNKTNHVKSTSASNNNVATIDSTLILKGVNGDATSKDELAIIAKAFVSAYNDVHWNTNHYLVDAEIPFSAGTADDPDSILCKYCPDDDSMGAASSTKTLVLDVVTPVVGILCKYCPDDDSMGSKFDMESLKSNDFNKKAVEVAFCKKLQNSVSDKLSNTKSCSIAVESVIAATASAKAW